MRVTFANIFILYSNHDRKNNVLWPRSPGIRSFFVPKRHWQMSTVPLHWVVLKISVIEQKKLAPPASQSEAIHVKKKYCIKTLLTIN